MTVLEGSINWTRSRPAGVENSTGSPCLAYEHVWMCFNHAVYGYDRLTGAQTHCFTGFDGAPRVVRPFEGGLLVASFGSQKIYKVELEGSVPPRAIATYNAKPDWAGTRSGSVFLYSSPGGLWRVPPTAEKVPPTKDGQIIGGVGKDVSLVSPVLAPDAVFLPRKPNFIDVIDPRTLEVRHTIALADMSMRGIVGSACNGPTTCLTVNQKTVLAFDTERGSVSWRLEANAQLTEAIAVDAKYCYVGTSDGRIFVFDIASGAPVKELQFGTAQFFHIYQDNGTVYASCFDGTDYFIGAANLQSPTLAKHKTTGPSNIVGIDHGVVYYYDDKTIGAVRLAELLREFYAESVLIQDFVFRPGRAEEKRPMIQTEVTLYTSSGAPWAMQTVRVGSTSPISIESGGMKYAIDSKGKYADIKTDGSGKLRISMPAGDVDSKGVFHHGLSSPAITLFTSFMNNDDRILVRPDAQLHDELAKVNKTRLQTTKSYDGEFVVSKEYRNNDAVMANVAGMIGATTSMVKDSLESRAMQLAGPGKRYLAPGCDMATICCCKAGDYDCKLLCKEAFAFDLDPACSHFSYLATKEQIERWLKEHPVSHQSQPMSWGDFWDAVKSGAAKVKNALVYAARKIDESAKDVVQTVVTVVVDKIEKTMNFVVDTIEHAIGLIHGIFNTIVSGISKVLETLSLIFDWQRIVKLKNDIKVNVENAFSRLLIPQNAGGKNLLTQARERGGQALGNLRGKLDRALDDLIGHIGTDSGSAVQSKNANKKSPALGGATSNWLQSKMNDNLLSDQAMRTHALSAGSAGSAIQIPTFVFPDGLTDDISEFLKDLQARVTGDVRDSIQRLQSALDVSNGDLFSRTFKFFMELVRGTLHIALDVASAIFDGAMILLEKMLNAAWSFIRDEKITIPFVSDLYRSFAHRDLTCLDLACLLIAVPASVLIPVTPGRRSTASVASAKLAGIFAGAGQMTWALLNGVIAGAYVYFAEKIEDCSPVTRILINSIRMALIASFGLVARGLLMWSDIASNEENIDALLINITLWVFPTLAVAVDLGGIALGMNAGMIPRTLYADGSSIIICGTGICAAGLLALFFLEKKMQATWILTFNALVAAGLIVRLGAIFEPLWVKGVAITITTGLILGSGVVKTVNTWKGPAGNEQTRL